MTTMFTEWWGREFFQTLIMQLLLNAQKGTFSDNVPSIFVQDCSHDSVVILLSVIKKVRVYILLQINREWLPSFPKPKAHVSSFSKVLALPSPSVNAPFYRYLMLLQATLNRKK